MAGLHRRTASGDRDLNASLNDVWLVAASAAAEPDGSPVTAAQAATPVFSPDGRQVAYLGHERGWTYGARTELLVVPVEGGESRSISGRL